ncbi:MAG: succinate--CoA ligase subunit alpha [Thermodesulfobacteriota bacterium]
MAILIDSTTRIIVQGITGATGGNIAGRMMEGGSPIVGGVVPGRGGRQVHGLPVFDSCLEARRVVGANASFVSVSAPFIEKAAYEAIDAGISVIVLYAEGVPILDACRIIAKARQAGSVVVGPNAAGVASPGLANLSDLNERFLHPGRVGVVSKSGTLSYEVVDQLNQAGLGVSTVVCIGGDPVIGTNHLDCLRRFEGDPETDAVVMVGEIGGRSELMAADFISRMVKPVVAYIAGREAPSGKRMGHAGALLGSRDENVPGKIARLEVNGAYVAYYITDIGDKVKTALLERAPGDFRRASE